MADLPLLGISCVELTALSDELAGLKDLALAAELAGRVHDFQHRIPASGLSGEAATLLISRLNDQLTARVLSLVARRHRLPPTEWCWLSMGSEGRDEQTLVTDQDNGLVFLATSTSEAQAMRQLFLPFAQEANDYLATCGFTRCLGDIMAGNPMWCLSLDEWRNKFIDWVRCPEPEALLNATIFFDFRPLYGCLELGTSLRELISRLTVDATAFQHLMAVNALVVQAPLGFLGDVAVDNADTVDLKKLGSRLFVDAARILALANGVSAVNTFDRLRDIGAVGAMKPHEVSVAQAALSQLLRLRLAHQASQSGLAGEGFRPAALHEIDRVILRETLRQARHLQLRLKLNYSL